MSKRRRAGSEKQKKAIEPVDRSIRQDNTRQDKTRQDKTRQDKTRQDKTRQDKTRQDKTRQDKTRQDKTRQDKTRQDKTRQDKTGPGHGTTTTPQSTDLHTSMGVKEVREPGGARIYAQPAYTEAARQRKAKPAWGRIEPRQHAPDFDREQRREVGRAGGGGVKERTQGKATRNRERDREMEEIEDTSQQRDKENIEGLITCAHPAPGRLETDSSNPPTSTNHRPGIGSAPSPYPDTTLSDNCGHRGTPKAAVFTI